MAPWHYLSRFYGAAQILFTANEPGRRLHESIWGYMDFHRVAVDVDRFNRFENLKCSDFARGSQYVEAFGPSYLQLQLRALAPIPYHAALRLLNIIWIQYPFLRDTAIEHMEKERMCANAFPLRQPWRTVEFLVQ
ncbi:hypothetical protein N7486_011458 [Penicillium sp. IBT 16267x]|nr:hypothetical protein N7486_011458 [Penicillium sp. IBT 16267x]